jgi:hypothetical protein
MSVTRTFTVTVVDPGSGNKYYIDGVQQATINIAENGTYKFDQSDSSNSSHPLRFSTTSDGTHNSGSEYTTGVTYYGTPGYAGAYTQITVAESAPTLYYYCSNHPGMGGQANTVDDNTYGMWAWGTNEWGDQGPISVALTAPSTATSSVGSVIAAQLITVDLTAPSALTSAVGSVGFGLNSIISMTAPSQMTSELGSFDNAGTLVGWGRNGWGEEPYGDSFNKLVQLSGLSSTASVGAISPADVVGITAPGEATASVGAISPADVMGLTGQSSIASVGIIVEGIGVVVTAPSAATSSVGAITPDDLSEGLTAPSAATASIGSPTVDLAVRILPTAPSAATSSVGSILLEIGVPLTAPSAATASVGAITPADSVGLTGLEVTAEIGTTGFGTLAYKDIDITGNTSYTDVTHVA